MVFQVLVLRRRGPLQRAHVCEHVCGQRQLDVLVRGVWLSQRIQRVVLPAAAAISAAVRAAIATTTIVATIAAAIGAALAATIAATRAAALTATGTFIVLNRSYSGTGARSENAPGLPFREAG